MASPLSFLADESCDFAVVRALRADGYQKLAALLGFSSGHFRLTGRELSEMPSKEAQDDLSVCYRSFRGQRAAQVFTIAHLPSNGLTSFLGPQ